MNKAAMGKYASVNSLNIYYAISSLGVIQEKRKENCHED